MLLTNFTPKKSEQVEFAWWVEIITLCPSCIYYFGPFASLQEAASAQVGYVEDLTAEGAKGIKLRIKLCKPTILTNYYQGVLE